jgi:lysophospholipase L1-like esterase
MAAPSAKRMAAAAAVGGGGLTVLTGASIGLVMAEAKLARRAIGQAVDAPPRADGLFGEHLAARESAVGDRPLRFAMLGDSTAAGYGVDQAEHTPGALLAAALAAHCGRPLLLANAARVGARSDLLAEQVDTLLADGPDQAPQVAAIMIGANDITHRMPIPQAAMYLGEAVERLRAAGCEVVVGTCPDLGTIRPIQLPLRWLARRWSRRLATLQARAVHSAGGRSVPIGALLGPEFAARAELFGPDRFHPSAEGYTTAVAALLPALAAAVWQINRAQTDPAAGDLAADPAPPESAAVPATTLGAPTARGIPGALGALGTLEAVGDAHLAAAAPSSSAAVRTPPAATPAVSATPTTAA